MSNNNKCYKGGNQHKFAPRYSEVPLEGVTFNGRMSSEDVIRSTRLKEYICDVCEWCGKTIKKEK